MTASVYGIDEDSKGIPHDGAIVRIRKIWAPRLFMNQACQFTTSLDSITVQDNRS